MRLIPRFLVVTLTLLGCVGCDQVSKSAARALLTSGIAESFLGDALRLQLVQNPGSFLSLGASLPEHLRFALFTGAVAVLLLCLVGASLFATRLGFWRFIALALIAGGGIQQRSTGCCMAAASTQISSTWALDPCAPVFSMWRTWRFSPARCS